MGRTKLIADKVKEAIQRKQEPEPEPVQEQPEEPEQPDRMEEYRREEDYRQEEGLEVGRFPTAKDTTQIWDRKAFGTPQINGAPLSKTILPSMATSNYPVKVDIISELSVSQNALVYGQIGPITKLEDRYEKNKGRYWLGDKVDPNENPFREHKELLITKLQARNMSYLSIDMAGLKEMNAIRKHLNREEKQKPIDEKMGVRA